MTALQERTAKRGQGKAKYATKAKVEFAISMAKLAGIGEIGSMTFSPDGTVRIDAGTDARRETQSVDDEIARWRAKKGR